jgi:hypothetical protein
LESLALSSREVGRHVGYAKIVADPKTVYDRRQEHATTRRAAQGQSRTLARHQRHR